MKIKISFFKILIFFNHPTIQSIQTFNYIHFYPFLIIHTYFNNHPYYFLIQFYLFNQIYNHPIINYIQLLLIVNIISYYIIYNGIC
mmetsp:Transcript_36018/g.94674  ORF Transcript_36018/g.94674 Transcript_36018/m.94674 type:complete len:86 (-) Transcript_36018:507-764(-)